MSELLELELFRNAAASGLMIAVVFGLISFFIVTNKLTFLGAGISHTAFGGVAIGLTLGTDPYLSALVFCTAAALLIGRISRSAQISSDTVIGIFFSLSMAIGGILLSQRRDYSFDLSAYLFGSILGVTPFDLKLAAAVFAFVILTVIIFFNRLIYTSFDRDSAEASGMNTGLYDMILLAALASSIVAAIKVAGIILVTALVALPASFGLLIFQRIKPVIAAGMIFSILTVEGGLVLSFYADTPPGATMAALGGSVYLLSVAIKKIYKTAGGHA